MEYRPTVQRCNLSFLCQHVLAFSQSALVTALATFPRQLLDVRRPRCAASALQTVVPKDLPPEECHYGTQIVIWPLNIG